MKRTNRLAILLCFVMFIGVIISFSQKTQAATSIPPIAAGKTATRKDGPGRMTYSITLTGATSNAKLRGKSSYFTYKKTSTNKYEVTVDANSTGKTRVGSIAFYEGTKTWEFKVEQAGFTASSTKLSFYAAAGEAKISTNYDASSYSSNASWAHIEKSSAKNYKIKVDMNPNSTSRSATLTFYYNGAKLTIAVTQTANSLKLSGYDGAKRSGKAYSNYFKMTASTPSNVISSVTSDQSWLSVSKSGMTITVTIKTDNTGAERSGKVTVKSGNITQVITVTQKNLMATIAEAEYNTYAGKAYDGAKYKNWMKTVPGFEWVNSSTAWCACFASWCAKEAGYISKGTMTANPTSLEIVNWLSGKKRYIKKADASSSNVKAGMLVFFDHIKKSDAKAGTREAAGVADHVGVVVGVSGGNITVVEGNMTGNGGKCIQKNTYSITAGSILGYGNIIP